MDTPGTIIYYILSGSFHGHATYNYVVGKKNLYELPYILIGYTYIDLSYMIHWCYLYFLHNHASYYAFFLSVQSPYFRFIFDIIWLYLLYLLTLTCYTWSCRQQSYQPWHEGRGAVEETPWGLVEWTMDDVM